MGFKKALRTVQQLQQTFQVQIPDNEGGTFQATFRLLTGQDSIWTFRINSDETESSFNFIYDLRAALASLISLEGEDGSTLRPVEVVKVLFTEDQLQNPGLLLDSQSDELSQKLCQSYWESLQRVNTEEAFRKLPEQVKFMLWDLLYLGFWLNFDPEYLMIFTSAYRQEYRRVRPEVVGAALLKRVDQMIEGQKKLNELANLPPPAPEQEPSDAPTED